MPARRRVSTLRDVSVQTCRHHWMIEFAQDATSKGVCRLCGEEREFSNNLQPATQGRDRTARASRAQQTEWEPEEVGSLVP